MNKLFSFLLILALLSCNDDKPAGDKKKEKEKEKKTETTEPKKQEGEGSYDLNNPEKILMPDVLTEVSGISFYKGQKDMLYAEQDEEGKLFYLKPGDSK